YGLIVKEKEKVITSHSVFNDDSDSDGTVEKPTGLKRALKKQDKIVQHRAIEEDPTVYQYDEIYDEMDKKRKESKLSRKDLDRKPKYINRLLAAADRRKKENERRIERQVQRERETEGDEFRDKEAFVTSSYKKKLEEMKEMDELEKREDYLESIGDVKKQGNLDGFYRHLYDQKVNCENTDEENESSSEKINTSTKSENLEDKNKINMRKYRKRNGSDDSEHEDNDVEVKREHLPSNLDADSDFSIDSSDSADENEKADEDSTTKIEKNEENEKPEEQAVSEIKDSSAGAPEEIPHKKPKIDIWKKRTVGEVFDLALQRYFERKALREL
ncbi:nuclear speckle splicing regulatory protein 1, partial [Asbolus verrucosus]